jgi:hypothetical protein
MQNIKIMKGDDDTDDCCICHGHRFSALRNLKPATPRFLFFPRLAFIFFGPSALIFENYFFITAFFRNFAYIFYI